MQPVVEEGETQTRLASFAETRYPVNTVVVICHVTKANLLLKQGLHGGLNPSLASECDLKRTGGGDTCDV